MLQIFNQSSSRYSTKMMSKIVSMMTLVSSLSASPVNVESTKAASPYVNLGCQCSSLTFVDQYGTVQGNCRSADSTGALWGYVDSAYSSTCQDKQFSARFPNNPWSYEHVPLLFQWWWLQLLPLLPSLHPSQSSPPTHQFQLMFQPTLTRSQLMLMFQSSLELSHLDLDPTLEPSSLTVNLSPRNPAVEVMLSSFKQLKLT